MNYVNMQDEQQKYEYALERVPVCLHLRFMLHHSTREIVVLVVYSEIDGSILVRVQQCEISTLVQQHQHCFCVATRACVV